MVFVSCIGVIKTSEEKAPPLSPQKQQQTANKNKCSRAITSLRLNSTDNTEGSSGGKYLKGPLVFEINPSKG